jgi:hypothetical protein
LLEIAVTLWLFEIFFPSKNKSAVREESPVGRLSATANG